MAVSTLKMVCAKKHGYSFLVCMSGTVRQMSVRRKLHRCEMLITSSSTLGGSDSRARVVMVKLASGGENKREELVCTPTNTWI